MTTLSAAIKGISLIGPGLADWPSARQVLRGAVDWHTEETEIAPPEVLSARERRRTSPAMRLALNTAHAACRDAGVDPATTASVFSSAVGSGSVTDRIFTALATELKQVSPTDFHNSVHNAAAGYWSIGTQSHAPSTSIAAGDFGFGAGLLRAMMQVSAEARNVLLVCFEHPFPEPLHGARTFGPALGVGLVLSPVLSPVLSLGAQLRATQMRGEEFSISGLSPSLSPSLSKLAESTPPGRALTLLALLAHGEAGTVHLPHAPGQSLAIEVTP